LKTYIGKKTKSEKKKEEMNLMRKAKTGDQKTKDTIDINSDEEIEIAASTIASCLKKAKRSKPSAFLGRKNDFLRHPYKKKFLSLSRVVNDNYTKEQDFQYRIDPKHCIFCQKGQKLEVDVSKNYNVFVHYAMETLAIHTCPQRAHEKSKVGLVSAMIVSEEFPSGIVHFFSPEPETFKPNTVRSFAELGHLLDHAGTIFGDHHIYEVLRATPTYLNSLDELKLAFDVHKPWPFESDPTVPKELREWYKQYCLANGGGGDTIEKKKDTRGENADHKDDKTNKPAPIIASLDPRVTDWIEPPLPEDHRLDYEGPPTLPDKHLTEWDYDPAIHNEEYQNKLWRDGKKSIHEKQRASGPSFLKKWKQVDD
jgi:hypothetical protein